MSGRGGRGGRGDRGGGGGGRGGGGGGRGGYGGGGGGGGGPKPTIVFKDARVPLAPPDAGVRSIEDKFITSSKGIGAIANISVTARMPLRPGYGTQGKAIQVYANYYKINVPKNLTLTRYSVDVQPEAKGRKLHRIFELLLELPEFAGLATEWRSFIVSPRLLQIPDGKIFEIVYRGDGEDEATEKNRAKPYKVKVTTPLSYSITDYIKFLASDNPSASYPSAQEEVLQVLNAVFSHHTRADSNIASIGGSRVFSLERGENNNNICILGSGLEAIRGFFRSVRPATGGLLLNVNTTHGTFFEPIPLVVLYVRIGDQNKENLKKHLRLVRVSVNHLPPKKNKTGQLIPRVKTICGLAEVGSGRSEQHPPQIARFGAGPKDVKFWLSAAPPAEGQAAAKAKPGKGPKGSSQAMKGDVYITVFDYFSQKYPTIRLEPTHSVVNVGTFDRPMFLPAEVCTVMPGNQVKRRLSPLQTQNMIRFACRAPWENANSITQDGPNVLGLKPSLNAVSNQLGLQVQQGLLVVNARVLNAPPILYKSSTKGIHKENPRFGSWNMANIMFHTGANIGRWTFIDFTPGQGSPNADVTRTVMNFKEFMRASGINSNGLLTTPPPIKQPLGLNEHQNKKMIDSWFDRLNKNPSRPQFVLCVLPAADVGIYNAIKTLADTKYGLHTVCVVANKFMKQQRQEQYFANISLKFNLKAGGINHTLEPAKLGIISEGQTMVVGLDVTHPSPGSKEDTPSAAGIVASIDKFLGQWPCDFRIQEAKKEMVTGIESLFLGRLKVWQKYQKNLPKNIIIYRDGVSEGQFELVLEQELPGIRNACRQLYPADATKQEFPKISIIVCGKRHHTRFYPTDVNNADRSSNCYPGTVVDRGVTEVRNWDFFLQPHACLQGTARSCHYYVILDEIFRAQKPKAGQSVADSLEDLTHNMCHLFGRATKAVSLCPPAYYADLLCERLRAYLSKKFDPHSDDDGASQASTDDGSNPEVAAPLKDSMFYI